MPVSTSFWMEMTSQRKERRSATSLEMMSKTSFAKRQLISAVSNIMVVVCGVKGVVVEQDDVRNLNQTKLWQAQANGSSDLRVAQGGTKNQQLIVKRPQGNNDAPKAYLMAATFSCDHHVDVVVVLDEVPKVERLTVLWWRRHNDPGNHIVRY